MRGLFLYVIYGHRMNPATQRPGQTPDPGVMWYECQMDCWGAQHGAVVDQYLDDNGCYYQIVDYMDTTIVDECPMIVIHGPAPKSWVDASNFGCVDPQFLIPHAP